MPACWALSVCLYRIWPEGSPERQPLAAAGVPALGGAFVLLCDVLARVLFAPFEIPVGIVMSLLGGPFFLVMLLRRKRSRVYD